MPEFLAEGLRPWVESLGIGPDSRIFTFTKTKLHHGLDRGCAKSHVKRILIHDLRHSHVSLLIEMGFSAVAIAERLTREFVDLRGEVEASTVNTERLDILGMRRR